MAWCSGSGDTMKLIGGTLSQFGGYDMISAINRTPEALQAVSDVE